VLYPDADGDGVGAPPRSIECLGAELPPGFSQRGWDVGDTDPAVQCSGDDEDLIALFL
jgi:hypothetical protein